jgi:hypothetical protein
MSEVFAVACRRWDCSEFYSVFSGDDRGVKPYLESNVRPSSPFLMERLSELEQELADTKAKMLYSEPREVKLRLKDVRRFAEARLKHLQTMFSGEPRIARAEIGKHVQKITLTPEGSSYIASGTWDVLGAWQHGWCRGPGLFVAAHDPVLCQTGGLASDVVRFELTTFGL